MEEKDMETTAADTTEIVGVRFKDAGKVYFFAPGDIQVQPGDAVIVETSRGMEYGMVAASSLPKKYVSVAAEEDVWQEAEAEEEESLFSGLFQKSEDGE